MEHFSIPTLKDEYIKLMCDHIYVIPEDLSINEIKLIDKSYELFMEKMEDLRILGSTARMLSIEVANLNAMRDDSDNFYEDDDENEKFNL